MTPPHDKFGLTEDHWDKLIRRVSGGKCVPIVGSQLLTGIVPRREQLARKWADKTGYPLAERSELSMVSEHRGQFWKDDKPALLDEFQEFALEEEAKVGIDWHGTDSLNQLRTLRTLVELPFDIFITTSYFDALEKAIVRFRPNSEPIPISCQWSAPDHGWDPDPAPELDVSEITYDRPIVFYLHGRLEDPGSLVLTETDHMAFADGLAANLNQHRDDGFYIPPFLHKELTQTTWFFLGYGAADRNLRGLLRALGRQVDNPRSAVAVQLQTGDAVEGLEEAADAFLTEYFRQLLDRPVEVVLHDVDDFLREIQTEVTARAKANQP